MSDTSQDVQPQKMASGSKFCIWEVEGLFCVAKTKVLITQLILYCIKKIFNIRNSLMNCYNIV